MHPRLGSFLPDFSVEAEVRHYQDMVTKFLQIRSTGLFQPRCIPVFVPSPSSAKQRPNIDPSGPLLPLRIFTPPSLVKVCSGFRPPVRGTARRHKSRSKVARVASGWARGSYKKQHSLCSALKGSYSASCRTGWWNSQAGSPNPACFGALLGTPGVKSLVRVTP